MSATRPDHFCYMPWSALAVLPDGRITTCCVAFGFRHELGDLHLGDNLEKVWRGEKLKAIRKQFLNGEWPQGCVGCKARYERNLASQREHYTQLLKDYALLESVNTSDEAPPIFHLDLSFSNICNLACRTCSSTFSNKWSLVEQHLNTLGLVLGSQPSGQEGGRGGAGRALPENSFSKLITHPSLFADLRSLTIKGGEPLLSKDLEPFLNMLVTRGYASKINLNITTNGTIAPNQRLLGLLSEFASVRITVSVDGTGKLFEYIRVGKNFPLETVESTIRLFQELDKARLIIYPTIQAYNIFNLEELYEWSQKMRVPITYRHILNSPNYLSIRVLPEHLRAVAQKKLSSFMERLKGSATLAAEINDLMAAFNQRPEPDQYRNFLQFTNALDHYYQVKLEDLVPEFKDLRPPFADKE